MESSASVAERRARTRAAKMATSRPRAARVDSWRLLRTSAHRMHDGPALDAGHARHSTVRSVHEVARNLGPSVQLVNRSLVRLSPYTRPPYTSRPADALCRDQLGDARFAAVLGSVLRLAGGCCLVSVAAMACSVFPDRAVLPLGGDAGTGGTSSTG